MRLPVSSQSLSSVKSMITSFLTPTPLGPGTSSSGQNRSHDEPWYGSELHTLKLSAVGGVRTLRNDDIRSVPTEEEDSSTFFRLFYSTLPPFPVLARLCFFWTLSSSFFPHRSCRSPQHTSSSHRKNHSLWQPEISSILFYEQFGFQIDCYLFFQWQSLWNTRKGTGQKINLVPRAFREKPWERGWTKDIPPYGRDIFAFDFFSFFHNTHLWLHCT